MPESDASRPDLRLPAVLARHVIEESLQIGLVEDRLFEVAVKRTYAGGKPPADSVLLAFGADAGAIEDLWGGICERQNVHWGHLYKDRVTAVKELDLQQARLRASEHPARCCDLAVVRPCVCRISFLCPAHGRTCHGSHD